MSNLLDILNEEEKSAEKKISGKGKNEVEGEDDGFELEFNDLIDGGDFQLKDNQENLDGKENKQKEEIKAIGNNNQKMEG